MRVVVAAIDRGQEQQGCGEGQRGCEGMVGRLVKGGKGRTLGTNEEEGGYRKVAMRRRGRLEGDLARLGRCLN